MIETLTGGTQVPSSVHAHDERRPGEATTSVLHLRVRAMHVLTEPSAA